MSLFKDLRGISKLILILLLLAFFLLGATLSYIWTMGFYAPQEFHLPKQTNLTIEDVRFPPENATFFNVTVLNPSYSPSSATIEQIKVSTNDDKTHDASLTSPTLPLTLAPGEIQTIQSFWNWGNYTGQTVDVYAVIAQGSGPVQGVQTAFMNFSVTAVSFNASLSAKYFNITLQNVDSSTPVNITKVRVNGTDVATLPTLIPPYGLGNSSTTRPVTFLINQTWLDFQGKNVVVAVETAQGYTAFKTVKGPSVSLTIIPPLLFNATDTGHFTVRVVNGPTQPGYVTVNEVEVAVYLNGTLDKIVVLNSTSFVASPSPVIVPSTFPTSIDCTWDWSGYLGKGAKVTATVRTIQGFQTPPLTEQEIP